MSSLKFKTSRLALALLAAGLATPLLAPLPTLLENAATDGAAD